MGPESETTAKCKVYFCTDDGYHLIADDRFEEIIDSVDENHPVITGEVTGTFDPLTLDVALHFSWWERLVLAFFNMMTKAQLKATEKVITNASKRISKKFTD